MKKQEKDEVIEVFTGHPLRYACHQCSQLKEKPLPDTDYFAIQPSKTKFILFKPDDFVAAASNKKGVLLYLRGDSVSLNYRKLQLNNMSMGNLVKQVKQFHYLQIHKQSLINLDYLAGIDHDEILLTFKTDEHLYIGRTFTAKVKSAIRKYLEQKTFFLLLGR